MTRICEPVGYEAPESLFGALQRGLGRGAMRADAAAVMRCLERDQRWDTQVDDRAVYLARLVRDLRMPVRPLLGLLREPPEEDTFHNVSAVLETLGRAGDREAVAGLRAYVADGPRWTEVLEDIAGSWPRELWDDLLTVARERLPGSGERVWRSRPWTDWATADASIAGELPPEERREERRPLRDETSEALVALLGTAEVGRQAAAMRELNRRGPQPALLPLFGRLPGEPIAGGTWEPSPDGPGLPDSPLTRLVAPGPLRGPLARAVRSLGGQVVPAARRWAGHPDHPLAWRAVQVLADHGDERDLPVLLAEWDRLNADPDAMCGFDVIAEGVARIIGTGEGVARIAGQAKRPAEGEGGLAGLVKRLHELWVTPHSHERAAYLRALLILDPDGAGPLLAEGLWDCEAAVREIAVRRAPLGPEVRVRVARLRDDPIEEEEVRAAAAARLG